MKILRNLCYILQGKMGKTEKNREKSHTTKVSKIPKTKRRKYGMNEISEKRFSARKSYKCFREANKQKLLYCSHTFSIFHEKGDQHTGNEQSVKSVSKHAYA